MLKWDCHYNVVLNDNGGIILLVKQNLYDKRHDSCPLYEKYIFMNEWH